MLTIRFKREGVKKQGLFRIVAVDKRISAASSKNKGVLGWWDPKTKKSLIKKDLIMKYLKEGAIPSATVHNFLVKNGLIKSAKIAKHKKAKKKEEVAA